MSLPQNRAAAREREAAKIFGSKRFVRTTPKGRAPDVLPFTLETGEIVQPEVKNGMKRLPRELVKALEQARSYAPDAVPMAVFSDVGGEAIACVPAKALARWLKVAPETLNDGAVRKRKATRKRFVQMDLPLGDPALGDAPSVGGE